ncbi:hypothetical protein PV08_09021 [Exophiala spinifera]|uniref:Uncharacterized protein n=1 Tax=Exophiala spinifera TaxID=91928 RepID=A0A0D2BKD5_9EURO|nr:uncharacterized protein PV08_09021 [Exophiala spinifera]KIW11749.1 hypothetical protein PV08_09021 [Exophiala spinifera]
MRLSPSSAVLLFAIFVSASPPSETTSPDLIVPEHGVHANASTATTAAAGPETTPPPEDDLVLQQLNKRDSSDTCGVISTTTLTCAESKGPCVWDPTPGGPFGCCPINEAGHADSSCIFEVKCIDFADYYLDSSTEPPDQATLVCFDNELSTYVDDNPYDVAFAAAGSSVVENHIEMPKYKDMMAENMPGTLSDYDDTDSIPLFAINDDQRAAAIEPFDYFLSEVLELLDSSAMLPRQAEDSDTTIEMEKELTRTQLKAMLFQMIALNPDRCSVARQIRAYTGRVNVTTTTLNIAAGPLGPSFTTVFDKHGH